MERETSGGGDGAPMSCLLELEEPASRERMGKRRGRVQSSSVLSSICPPPRLLPYLERQLSVAARRLTVEDTVAA